MARTGCLLHINQLRRSRLVKEKHEIINQTHSKITVFVEAT
jgi:hypothetical protein